ncbi:hypothetical protein EGM51_08310 [Verrucomicrobia bacterium S94]|nr:hypothetical protein EGM51_08310 [Verrucomicrobia bacterium S94]
MNVQDLLEQLDVIEGRLERSFCQGRFDTFNQLLSDRLVLLKQARQLPDNECLFQHAREQSARWKELLAKTIHDQRQRQEQNRKIKGYGRGGVRPGRVLNRSV